MRSIFGLTLVSLLSAVAVWAADEKPNPAAVEIPNLGDKVTLDDFNVVVTVDAKLRDLSETTT